MTDSYILYIDKPTIFECKISLEGTTLKDTTARLVVETPKYTLLYNGDINERGECKIPVSKLSEFVDAGFTGNIRLEVISDEMFFRPWTTTYVAETARKLTVEVASPPEAKSKVKVSVKSNNMISGISQKLKSNGITLENILDNKQKVNKLLSEHKISHLDLISILRQLGK